MFDTCTRLWDLNSDWTKFVFKQLKSIFKYKFVLSFHCTRNLSWVTVLCADGWNTDLVDISHSHHHERATIDTEWSWCYFLFTFDKFYILYRTSFIRHDLRYYMHATERVHHLFSDSLPDSRHTKTTTSYVITSIIYTVFPCSLK